MAERSTLERRAALEWRAAGRRLEGIVVRYGVETRIDNFVEKVAPGAFDRSLASGQDIIALVDHDVTALLGRTRSGTLHLRSDQDGLGFTVDLPNTTVANDVLALAEANSLGGMSFGFTVPPDGERWQGNVRELRSIDLREVSVVSAWPAYPETVVAARARMNTPARLRLARLYLETVRP